MNARYRPPMALPASAHRPAPWAQSVPAAAGRSPVAVIRILGRGAVLLAAAVAVAMLVWGALLLLAKLPLFHVERVEVTGVSYLTREEVRAAAGVDATTSVWERKSRLLKGVEGHPLVESARVERKLPSTLVVSVAEAEPVGLIASPLVAAVDQHGNVLPIDPTKPVLDLPVLRVLTPRAAASWGIRLLAREVRHMAEVAPEIFAVISEAHLDDRQVTLLLGDSGLRVRYVPPISETRLREAIIAMNDAVTRLPDAPPREVDLRFQDQVVVRTEAALAGWEGGAR